MGLRVSLFWGTLQYSNAYYLCFAGIYIAADRGSGWWVALAALYGSVSHCDQWIMGRGLFLQATVHNEDMGKVLIAIIVIAIVALVVWWVLGRRRT